MRISVVIPLYNEEECVRPLCDELLPVILELDPNAEVLLVDDGSTDQTSARISEVQRRWPQVVRHLGFAENCGQTAALDAGFKNARGELIVTLDGDLQIDPRDIPRLVELASEFDVVHGWRQRRHDGWFKLIQTRIANRIRNWLTRSDIHDTGCPLKVFRREVVRDMKLFTGMHRFLITLARLEGHTTKEVPVTHRPRAGGRSKYGMWNRALPAFRDLLAVRWMMARHFRYRLTEFPSPDERRP